MKNTDIISWRKSLGMDQSEFGRFIADVHARTVRRWENGEWPIPAAIENQFMLMRMLSAPKRAVAIEIMKQRGPQ